MLSSSFRQRDGLKIRREILQRIKTQVQLYLGSEPAALRSYALAYKKDIERASWKASSTEAFLQALEKADVVFGGDFHAYSQAQRVHLRNLRNLAPFKKIVLGVECIPSRHQKALDRFMKREITEAEFLKKVAWEKNWGFSWGQYKPLFDLVRETGGRCVALNLPIPKRTLKALHQRDRHAAEILKKTYQKKSREEGIYVIYGDLHIARERLPLQFKKAVKSLPAPKVVSIYLNPEKIYFQLFKKNLEHKVNVVQFSKSEFCLLESPPWVKWQSYLIFLEETMDESIFDDDGAVDYSEHVLALLKMMASDLGLNVEADATVYSFNDHDFLDILADKMHAGDFTMVKEFVQNDLGFYAPKEDCAFLPRGTVNYAAHLAGNIFHSRLCKRQKFLLRFPHQFVNAIWLESVAFFLSKLVNPHRKSSNLNDIKKQLAAFSPGDGGEEALKLALDQKMRDLVMVYGAAGSEDDRPLRKTTALNFYKASKLLGAMMGERLYGAFKSGRLSRAQVATWLAKSVDRDDFQDFYIQVLKDLDRMEAGDGYG